jgi:predicted nucleic acid-binding protein
VKRARAEELLSDYREGTLDPILRAELEAYLATDDECRQLLAALDLVAEAMPALPAAEPSADLTRRVAAAAWRAGRRNRVLPFRERLASLRIPLPAVLQAAAAVLLVVTGVAGLVAGPDAGPSRAASRFVLRAGVELRESRDRLVQSLKLLQVVVGTAFESRLDRMGDRVEDFRQLLEERRSREREPSEGDRGSDGGGARAVLEGEPGVSRVRISSRSHPRGNRAACRHTKEVEVRRRS